MTATVTARRIAMMLESDGPGGAEMMVFQLSKELRRRGHTIVPVGPAEGIGWLGDLYRNAGFSPEAIHVGRKWIDRDRARALTALFRAHGITLVHSHEFEMATYGTVAARLVGIPHVFTMHGGLTVTKAIQRRVALRLAMRLSAFAVVVSDATRRQFATDLGVREARFEVVHNGVPVAVGDAERVRGEFGCTRDDLVLLAVGTLERNKGHHVLLDALLRLEARGLTQPWKLIVAGGRGGDQHQPLLEFVRAHNLGARVHIVTKRNDIADLQALADIFVMPSMWEGLPMALLEAMLAGNAVVASATGGIPEAVGDQRDGLLVPPGDAEALANALGPLMTDPALRARYASAALQRATSEFTVQVMADRYEALYARAR